MTATSTDDTHVVAQAVHDLGAALWFGGSVMGAAGVNKAGEDLRDGVDTVRVAGSARRRFAPVQWLGIGAVMVAGSQLTWQSKGRLAVQHGLGRAGAAQAAVAVWQRRQRAAQYLVPALAGANIVLNAYLTQQYRPGATLAGIARRLRPS